MTLDYRMVIHLPDRDIITGPQTLEACVLQGERIEAAGGWVQIHRIEWEGWNR